MSKYFQKPIGKKHDKAFADKWFAFLMQTPKRKKELPTKTHF